MAKLSKIHRQLQREEVVERYAKRRAELKTIVKSETATDEQKAAAVAELQKQPRNASATRLRNRDTVDGRPRGYLRKFGVSRIRFRGRAHRGELPGITKSRRVKFFNSDTVNCPSTHTNTGIRPQGYFSIFTYNSHDLFSLFCFNSDVPPVKPESLF
jgi:small subunit ribosomal protein S14